MADDPSLEQIPNAIAFREGLPRPDWKVIEKWLSERVPADRSNNAWNALVGDWLDLLVGSLPGEYCCDVSEKIILLSSLEAEDAGRLLRFCESARSTILETLAGVAQDNVHARHVVLAFSDEDSYYDYIADYYPEEGDFGLSVGMFIPDGYSHIAVRLTGSTDSERTLAHELTHCFMSHLPLPSWLNEGVTQVVEDLVVGHSFFQVDREVVAEHKKYWSNDSIQAFWSGEAFHAPDEGQGLSYHLARVLVANLMADHRKSFLEFLRNAHFTDAGEQALNVACGDSLSNRVSQFLGPGDWEPRGGYDTANLP